MSTTPSHKSPADAARYMSPALRRLTWTAIGLRDSYAPLMADRERALALTTVDLTTVPEQRTSDPVVVPMRRSRRHTHTAPPSRRSDYVHAHVEHEVAKNLHGQVPQMLHLSLTAAFDAFVGQLLRACYKLCPELLNRSDRTVTYADAALLDNDGLRGLFIERTVASVMHGSRQEQLNHLYKIGRLNPAELSALAEPFVEISERRNLYAHTGGRVSQVYVDKCRDVHLPTRRAPGEYISNDGDYFTNACQTTVLLASLLTYQLWRHLGGAGHVQAADEDLHELTYMLLVREEWTLAEYLLRAAVTSTADVKLRLYARVNLAQALKWQGQHRECAAELAQEHWSTKELAFQLAEAVLNDQYDLAGDLMRETALSGDIDRAAFDHWPLFRAFRSTEAFHTAYVAVFGEPCSVGGAQLALSFPSTATPE